VLHQEGTEKDGIRPPGTDRGAQQMSEATTRPVIVLGYVPGALGDAALAAAVDECGRRDAKLLVINSTRADRTVDVHYAFGPDMERLRTYLEAGGVEHEIRQFTSD